MMTMNNRGDDGDEDNNKGGGYRDYDGRENDVDMYLTSGLFASLGQT